MDTPAPSLPQGRLRVLCLHSFRTSGTIFKQQLQRAGLIDALSDLIDFIFVDAPHAASGPIPRDVRPYFQGPHYEWFTAESVGDRVEFDEEKMEASERYLLELLRGAGPFDGVMGFSQGAVMSSALVALQRSGMRPGLSELPPLRFCILFGGMRSRHADHVAAFDALGGKVPCPSLHVYGDKDALKNPHCVELADTFQSATVLLHQRGHVIPTLPPQQLAVARAFITAAGAAPAAAASIPTGIKASPAAGRITAASAAGRAPPGAATGVALVARAPTAAAAGSLAPSAGGRVKLAAGAGLGERGVLDSPLRSRL